MALFDKLTCISRTYFMYTFAEHLSGLSVNFVIKFLPAVFKPTYVHTLETSDF